MTFLRRRGPHGLDSLPVPPPKGTPMTDLPTRYPTSKPTAPPAGPPGISTAAPLITPPPDIHTLRVEALRAASTLGYPAGLQHPDWVLDAADRYLHWLTTGGRRPDTHPDA